MYPENLRNELDPTHFKTARELVEAIKERLLFCEISIESLILVTKEITRIKIKVAESNFDSSPFKATLMLHNEYNVRLRYFEIWLNRNAKPENKLFSVAHEIGHIVHSYWHSRNVNHYSFRHETALSYKKEEDCCDDIAEYLTGIKNCPHHSN